MAHASAEKKLDSMRLRLCNISVLPYSPQSLEPPLVTTVFIDYEKLLKFLPVGADLGQRARASHIRGVTFVKLLSLLLGLGGRCFLARDGAEQK